MQPPPVNLSHATSLTVSKARQSTGSPSQSTGPPSQSTGQPMSSIQKKHRGRVMCQPDIFTLFSGLLLINGAKYERHYNSSLSIMLNQNEFEIDIKCRPQLSKWFENWVASVGNCCKLKICSNQTKSSKFQTLSIIILLTSMLEVIFIVIKHHRDH